MSYTRVKDIERSQICVPRQAGKAGRCSRSGSRTPDGGSNAGLRPQPQLFRIQESAFRMEFVTESLFVVYLILTPEYFKTTCLLSQLLVCKALKCERSKVRELGWA